MITSALVPVAKPVLAERADHDRSCGPAGCAGPGDGDSEQGDADVAEERQRLERRDGAGVNAVEHGRGLGPVRVVSTMAGAAALTPLSNRTTSDPSTPSTPPAIARRGARGASLSASQTMPAMSRTRPVVLSVRPAIIAPR